MSNIDVGCKVNRYVVVIEFLSTPNGRIFYMAHVFSVEVSHDQPTEVYQASVTADTPQQALAEGEFLAWLLNL
jgi:hypothetical protein